MAVIKHIVTILAGFAAGYAMTEISGGYRYVALHFDWLGILNGLVMSGLYVGGTTQPSMLKEKP